MSVMNHHNSYRIKFILFGWGPVILGLILLVSGVSADRLLADNLDPDQCKKLYEHQLKIAVTDSDFDLQPAFQLNSRELSSAQSRRLQESQCIEKINEKNYQCQLNAETMIGLLQCSLRFGKISLPGIAPEDSTMPVSEKNDEKTSTVNPGTAVTEQKKPDVSAGECTKTYDHLVRVYSQFPRLKGDRNGKKLIEYWNSSEARESFLQNCIAHYSQKDVSCIVSAQKPSVIKSCLIEISE